MQIGELISANVQDRRVYDAEGPGGTPGIYTLGIPGRALPFVISRNYKVPVGVVAEELRLTGPSGRLVWRWGPNARRMSGSMEQSISADLIDDAVLDEAGTYLASFIIEGQVLGEVEIPVYLQSAPASLPKEFEEGLKKSDTIWIGTDAGGKPDTIPAWFVYKGGKILVLSQKEAGPEEQTVPGIPGAEEVLVVTRRKARDTALDRFYANVRVLEDGPEFEAAAKTLVDRRRSRVGPPDESLKRWRTSCVIGELTPVVPA